LNSLASAAERSEHTTTVEGIEKYLGSGMIRRIGPVYAKKLVRAFGEVVFDVIEQEPIPSGISPPSAPAAYSLKSPNASGSRVALTGTRSSNPLSSSGESAANSLEVQTSAGKSLVGTRSGKTAPGSVR
jgi:hypothetical protein